MKKLNRTSSVPRSSRLTSYSKVAVGSLAAASAAGSAEAAIVYFDVNPAQTSVPNSTLSFGSINLGTGTYTLNGLSDTSFGLYFSSFNGGLSGYLSTIGSAEWGYTTPYIERLALNDGISGASAWSWNAPPNGYLFTGYIGDSGNWGFTGNDDSKTGFAPLRIDAGGGNYNYGWVEVTTQVTNRSSTYLNGATVTVTGFAFEDQVNTAILAGDQGGPAPVPEPGTMAVGAGLFALAVGAHLRRRREKKAAASEALLNLAAGARGVEKFRADKAA